MNKVMLIGNLGNDPELKYTQSGTAICTFSLATSEKYKDRNGELQEKVEWHNITVWGAKGEAISKFCQKGNKLFVEGKLETQKWQD